MATDKIKTPYLYKLLRWLVFKVGDTRWLGWRNFPMLLTWDIHMHKIDLDEVEVAKTKLRRGDIILHRDEGFLSNTMIPGIMIHAGIYVGDQQVIEAISEGVVKRNVGHILYSDYACILRPKIGRLHKDKACDWAEKLVGMPYDVQFDFGVERERKALMEGEQVKVCCTEIPFFCYMEYVNELGVFRENSVTAAVRLLEILGLHPGRTQVTADMYVEANGFEIVWRSEEFTEEWAHKMNASRQFNFGIQNKQGTSTRLVPQKVV